MGTAFLWGDAKVAELDSGDGCTTLEYTENCWTVHLERVHFTVCELYLNEERRGRGGGGEGRRGEEQQSHPQVCVGA